MVGLTAIDMHIHRLPAASMQAENFKSATSGLVPDIISTCMACVHGQASPSETSLALLKRVSPEVPRRVPETLVHQAKAQMEAAERTLASAQHML